MKRKRENINLIVVCMIYGNISTVPVCAVLPWLPPAFESQTFDFTILIMFHDDEDNDYDDGDDDDLHNKVIMRAMLQTLQIW